MQHERHPDRRRARRQRAPDAGSATLLGLGPLVRKDVREWLRGKRAWVTAIVVTPLLGPDRGEWRDQPLGGRQLPGRELDRQIKAISLAPLDNFLAAIGTQFIIVAAIFATMSLLVAERDSRHAGLDGLEAGLATEHLALEVDHRQRDAVRGRPC